MLSFHIKFVQTDRRTMVKQYTPDLSMRGHKNKQRAITHKLSKQELRFMGTALPLDEIYQPTKFHNHS